MKIRDNICEMCGYAALEKGALKLHMASVHKVGEELKCKLCNHVSIGQRNLTRHIKKVHEKMKKY